MYMGKGYMQAVTNLISSAWSWSTKQIHLNSSICLCVVETKCSSIQGGRVSKSLCKEAANC